MSGQQYLSALSENASRLGARLQETLSERTRELTLARTGAGGDGIIGDLDGKRARSCLTIHQHLLAGPRRPVPLNPGSEPVKTAIGKDLQRKRAPYLLAAANPEANVRLQSGDSRR